MICAETEILLVEDRGSEVELTLATLGDLAEKVFAAPDGVERLDFAFGPGTHGHRSGEKPPEVIVLDLHLPKVSGLEVLQQLKSDDRAKSIPVVVLTSSAEGPNVKEAYRRGAKSYVVEALNAIMGRQWRNWGITGRR